MIFIFLDGVGIGKQNDENPFFAAKCDYLPFFKGNKGLPNGSPVKEIDALLGVEGLPNSASGQTTLYTGINVPKLLGKHALSFPNAAMREIIVQQNLLSQLIKKGKNAVFINAYPLHAQFFGKENASIADNGEVKFSAQFPQAFRRRLSATSCMMIAANQRPFDEADLIDEQCLYQDFSNRLLIERGFKIPVFSPEKAAKILYSASRNHDFILYEFFQTDVCGHRGSFDDQKNLVIELNRLIGHLLSLFDLETDTLILTSDHGNLEDNSSPMHTTNPVPFICFGNQSETIRKSVNSLADVTPTIVDIFSKSYNIE